ncbi:tetratricopeptide repeat protein [Aurantiacibacter aquimixticola]|uniref:Uncharacterized protein n=1 Tax=Aurantiacibacter aquimixticola TaxID=1958945 RepID=A0A419RRW2_9SPHN|nr:tetratricopeptide repeat protein [Aurantiacibacter aquimixticola]RJY08520.1 hypothetical protein D6201_03330 [Aurantiacibacter aquimixticola]
MMLRVLKLRLAFAAFVLPLAACSGDPLDGARDAFAAQDYAEARQQALAAVKADGANGEALLLLAQANIAMGQGADALAALDRLKDPDAASPQGTLIRAEALLQAGNREDALELLADLDSAEAWRLRALAAQMAGDDRAAADAFREGTMAAGDRSKLFTAAASFYLARGDTPAARRAIGEAQRLSPGSIETLFVSARLAQLDDKPELAARAYLAILERDPTDRPALLGAIRELDKLGRLDLITPLIQRGRRTYPADIDFVYLAASLEAFKGRWQAARDLLQNHESAVADHEDARGLYGEALLNVGQVEQARAMIAPLHRRHPDNAAYARLLTRILLESGEVAAARRTIAPFASRSGAEAIDRELAARAARG